MKCGSGEATVHLCDFCGMSSKGGVSMFISELDGAAAICKTCVDRLPQVYGKVLTVVPRVTPAMQLAQKVGLERHSS